MARAEPDCGARRAGAARPGGPAGGKAEPDMGCPVVGAPSAQAQKLAESSASFRPRSSREGFLEEEEAFFRHFPPAARPGSHGEPRRHFSKGII